MKVTKKSVIWITVALVFIIAIFSFTNTSSDKYDEFAQCLTDSNVKMFGAYWCPHCQDQKKAFGSSWSKVNYIECSLPNREGQTQECTLEGIEGYPTWEFADGSRRAGFVSLRDLSSMSGCALPQ